VVARPYEAERFVLCGFGVRSDLQAHQITIHPSQAATVSARDPWWPYPSALRLARSSRGWPPQSAPPAPSGRSAAPPRTHPAGRVHQLLAGRMADNRPYVGCGRFAMDLLPSVFPVNAFVPGPASAAALTPPSGPAPDHAETVLLREPLPRFPSAAAGGPADSWSRVARSPAGPHPASGDQLG
jgi:hypothetical protein